MYYQLTESLKKKLIEELRRYWKYHPKYPSLVNNIQGKFAFTERPQEGIVVKVSGGSKVDMSADNFRGTVRSYVYLAKVNNKAGFSLEWVREDSVAIRNNDGVFPSQAGVYYLDITEQGVFYIDPLLDYYEENLISLSATQFQFANKPLQGTARVYEMPNKVLLHEGTDYNIDYATNILTTVIDVANGRYLVADYRNPAPPRGPFDYVENRTNTTAIEGVILAFGRMATVGDQVAIVVQETRQPAYLEYGGRWELTLDCDILARDVHAQEEITDRTLIYLWGIARARLSTAGIEMKELSFGGESEEIYDDTGQDYYFGANFSVTLESEWAVHVPLIATLYHTQEVSLEKSKELFQVSDEEVASVQSDLQMLENLGLKVAEDPFFRKKNTFEKIT